MGINKRPGRLAVMTTVCAYCHAPERAAHGDDCELRPSYRESSCAPRLSVPMTDSIWKHYRKGGTYRIVGIASVERDLSPVVLYRREGRSHRVWSRPLREFMERFRPA